MLYFAYGSNLDWSRITDSSRAPNAQFLFKALLPKHSLAFTRRKKDGSGAVDVIPDEGDQVWGVVYQITADDRRRLDLREGVKIGSYRAQDLVVHPDGDLAKSSKVFTYVACEKMRDHQRPTREYLQYLIDGARHWGLPAEYQTRLEQIEIL